MGNVYYLNFEQGRQPGRFHHENTTPSPDNYDFAARFLRSPLNEQLSDLDCEDRNAIVADEYIHDPSPLAIFTYQLDDDLWRHMKLAYEQGYASKSYETAINSIAQEVAKFERTYSEARLLVP